MAELTTLLAAIYRKYTTIPADGFDSASPAISVRYEVFYDESCREFRVCFLFSSSHMLFNLLSSPLY